MKKLLLLLGLICSISVLSFGQLKTQDKKTFTDTITFERDTILSWPTTDNWEWELTVVVDSTAGTKDGLIEPVSAPLVNSADSLYKLWQAGYADSITTDYVHAWTGNATRGERFGVRFTLNNLTKWHITYVLTLNRKERIR